MKHGLKHLLAIIVSVHLFGASAQALGHDAQAWLQFYWQGPVDTSLRVYLEVQPRFGSDLSRFETILIRPAVYYQLTPAHSLWIGLGWTPTLIPSYDNEIRYWQQHSYRYITDGWSLGFRTRFEQRDLASVGDLSHRVREQLRFQHTIWEAPRLDAVVWDELFINLNGAAAKLAGGFNQNRVFAGVNLPVREKLNLEVGYLNVYVRRPVAAENRMNHALLLAVLAGF